MRRFAQQVSPHDHHGRGTECLHEAVPSRGGRVGLDLTKIGAIRNQRDLLEAILFPSESFARGYETWTIATDQGRVHSGLITRETADSLILRQTDLTEVRIRRASIEAMRKSDKSIMPDGLHHRLSDKELSDLLQFLPGTEIVVQRIDARSYALAQWHSLCGVPG